MKTIYLIFIAMFVSASVFSQEQAETTAIAPVSEQGENLELSAVLDLFKDAKDLEDFEKQLNDEKVGINNLDLNNDSTIDYIRVVEKSEGNYRVIILQAVLGENQFQDVATINVEKVSEEEVKVQCQGDEEIYGENYYVEPEPTVHVHVHLWPIWGVMYAPHYSYYHSPYYWRYYPTYWHPYRPVPYTTYSGRTVVVVNRGVYVRSRRPVVVRPPVYRRTYSSRTVVRTNPRYNNGRPSNGNNARPNNGSNTSNRNNSGNTSTRQNNSTNTRQNNSSTQQRNNSSTQQRNNSSTQQRNNSSTQQRNNSGTQHRSNSSKQRNNSSAQPRSNSSSQQRSGGNVNRSNSGSRSATPRTGGRKTGGRR